MSSTSHSRLVSNATGTSIAIWDFARHELVLSDRDQPLSLDLHCEEGVLRARLFSREAVTFVNECHPRGGRAGRGCCAFSLGCSVSCLLDAGLGAPAPLAAGAPTSRAGSTSPVPMQRTLALAIERGLASSNVRCCAG